MFSAQSKQGAEMAGDIKLVSEELPERKKEIILPPGVRLEEQEKKSYDGVTVEGVHITAKVEELPDDEDRKVTPDKSEEDMNREGTFERLMGFNFKGGMS